jgi:formate/nitrite transporter FocA (FNT family)
MFAIDMIILQPPAALYVGAVAAGAAKAKAVWSKIFTLGIVSGAHIGFGAYLAITVGGACPGLAASNPGLQKVSVVNQIAYRKTPIIRELI